MYPVQQCLAQASAQLTVSAGDSWVLCFLLPEQGALNSEGSPGASRGHPYHSQRASLWPGTGVTAQPVPEPECQRTRESMQPPSLARGPVITDPRVAFLGNGTGQGGTREGEEAKVCSRESSQSMGATFSCPALLGRRPALHTRAGWPPASPAGVTLGASRMCAAWSARTTPRAGPANGERVQRRRAEGVGAGRPLSARGGRSRHAHHPAGPVTS